MKIFDAKLTGSIEFLNPVAGNIEITGDLVVPGKITAREFHTEFTSASIIYASGSTEFGDTSDDIHEFTGTVRINRGADRKLQFTDTRGGKVWTIEHDTSNIYFWNATDLESPLSLQNDGDVIMNAGNVGIGTSSPNFKLQVNGDLAAEDNIYLTDAGTVRGRFELNASDRDDLDIVAASLSSNMKFFTQDTERMRINSDGNVGIGTTLPAYKLVISNEGAEGIEFGAGYLSGANLWQNYNRATSQYVKEVHYASEYNFLTGNVGIGTTSPNYVLDVEKSGANVRIYDTTGNTTLNLSSGNTANNNIEFGDPEDPNAGQIVYRHASDSMSFTTNASEAIRIDSNGNVGIGTTSPSEKLNIHGNANYFVATESTNGYKVVQIGADSSGDGNFVMLDSNGGAAKIKLYAEAGAANYINNGGNVGIGTSSPQGKLHVNAGAVSTPRGGGFTKFFFTGDNATTTYLELQTPSGSTGDILFSDASSGDYGIVGYNHANDSMYFYTNSSPRMLINSSGNVGVGTTSPATKVQIYDGTGGGAPTDSRTKLFIDASTEAYISINSPSDSFNGLRLAAAGTNKAFFELYDNVAQGQQVKLGSIATIPLNLVTGNSTKMTILNDGKVGIGTTSPSETLQVNGNIRIGVAGNNLLFDTTGANSSNGIRTINDYETVIFNGRGAAGFAVIGNSNIRLGFGTAYTDAQTDLFIKSDGNVGIGSTSPNQKLDVNGNVYASKYLLPDGGDVGWNGGYSSGNPVLAANGDEFRLYAAGNASTNILYLSDSRLAYGGNIGIGTTSPSSGGGWTPKVVAAATTAYPAVILKGKNSIEASIGAADAGLYVDCLGSSTGGNDIVFRNNNNTSDFNGQDRMRIHANGDITFCKSVTSVDTNGVFIQAGNDGAVYSSMGSPNNTYHVYNTLNNRYDFYVSYDGDVYARNTTIQSLSDERLKENIQDLTGSLDVITSLRPRVFDFKDGSKINSKGFVAQEVEQVLPECVKEFTAGEPLEDGTRYKTVGQDFMPYIVGAIKELKEENEALKARIQALEG